MSNQVKSGLLKMLGAILLILGIFLAGIAFRAPIDFFVRIIIGIIGAVLMFWGPKLIKIAKEMVVVSADTLLGKDNRKPILYLRSFKDDRLTSEIVNVSDRMPFITSNEEEQLVNALTKIGPVIAIGEPGSSRCTLGAARMFVPHGEWKQKVEELMFQSRLVVMRAGETEGFWWEVKKGIDSIDPEKIVFLIPKDYNVTSKFYRQVAEYLHKPVPAFDVNNNERYHSIRGMLYFNKDWTPKYTVLKRPSLFRFKYTQPFYSWVYRTIKPIIENIGMVYKPLEINWLVVLLILLVSAGLMVPVLLVH